MEGWLRLGSKLPEQNDVQGKDSFFFFFLPFPLPPFLLPALSDQGAITQMEPELELGLTIRIPG